MITLAKIRELDLAAAPAAGRPLHLSAASGLVCLGAHIYVVADDELHLGVFPAVGDEPGRLVRLFEGTLPDGKKDRKKRKPDLEGLTLLPADRRHPHGALFAVGSGSRDNRRLGVLLELDARGALVGTPQVVDLAPILLPLAQEFAALNIEGVLVDGGHLRLLQRGNARHGTNAIISFELAELREALHSGSMTAIRPSAIAAFELGEIGGVPLSFTDGAVLPNGATVFTAVAENTEDTYNDGPCAGAAVGVIDRDGVLRSLEALDKPHKVEGVHARVNGETVELLLVTDADDPDVPAGLYAAAMPG